VKWAASGPKPISLRRTAAAGRWRGRALVKRPKPLLLVSRWRRSTKKMREHTQFELIKTSAALGVTFIVVITTRRSHDLGTRLGFMNTDRIAQVGTPSDITNRGDAVGRTSSVRSTWESSER